MGVGVDLNAESIGYREDFGHPILGVPFTCTILNLD